VHDLEGLRRIGDLMAGPAAESKAG